MGDLMRSQPMQLVNIVMASDNAMETTHQLGRVGLVEFVDLNPDRNQFQRKYAGQIKRLNELQRILRFFEQEIAVVPELNDEDGRGRRRDHLSPALMTSSGLTPRYPKSPTIDSPAGNGYDAGSPTEAYGGMSRMHEMRTVRGGGAEFTPSDSMVDTLETRLNELYDELKSANGSWHSLQADYATAANHLLVLKKHVQLLLGQTGESIGQEEARYGQTGPSHESLNASQDEESLLDKSGRGEGADGGLGLTGGVTSLTGMLNTDKLVAFERVLWRVSRGNMYMLTSTVDAGASPVSVNASGEKGEDVEKVVFLIWTPGEAAGAKMKKVCEAFGASMFTCPNDVREAKTMLPGLESRQEELSHVVETTGERRLELLETLAEFMPLWKRAVRRLRGLYSTMNLFDTGTSENLLVAEGWVAEVDLDQVRVALKHASEASGSLLAASLETVSKSRVAGKSEAPNVLTPPTLFKTNKFTQGFQQILSVYGIPSYMEVNPAPFYMITFPFFFAIMFGDFGHGSMMLVFVVWMLLREEALEKQKRNELMDVLFKGRYVLLLMSLFSIYTGLMYNDGFGIAPDLFGTAWLPPDSEACRSLPGVRNDSITACKPEGLVYPLGVDPTWAHSPSYLGYYNSLKMKMSIIVGTIHMQSGMLMAYLNAKHFKRPRDIWYEWLPGIILLNSMIGYLVLLIVVKWFSPEWPAVNWDLIDTLISMFVSPGTIKDGTQIYPGQAFIQVVLALTFVICIPWMLFPKPFLAKRDADNKARQDNHLLADSDTEPETPRGSGGHGGGHGHDGEEFSFMGVFIHQAIHTIETALSAISHTASYLRLWALSLAHAELSKVFWENIMMAGLNSGSTPMMFVAFTMWTFCTVGILLGMESLSAFLHALRLHWVEYNSKFFEGEGHAWAPWSYAALDEAAAKEAS